MHEVGHYIFTLQMLISIGSNIALPKLTVLLIQLKVMH